MSKKWKVGLRAITSFTGMMDWVDMGYSMDPLSEYMQGLGDTKYSAVGSRLRKRRGGEMVSMERLIEMEKMRNMKRLRLKWKQVDWAWRRTKLHQARASPTDAKDRTSDERVQCASSHYQQAHMLAV